MRTRRSKIIIAVVALFLAIVIIDALGVFDTSPYTEVNHGDHKHYVPKDRDPDVSLDAFPTQPPGPNERINPQGQIVPL